MPTPVLYVTAEPVWNVDGTYDVAVPVALLEPAGTTWEQVYSGRDERIDVATTPSDDPAEQAAWIAEFLAENGYRTAEPLDLTGGHDETTPFALLALAEQAR